MFQTLQYQAKCIVLEKKQDLCRIGNSQIKFCNMTIQAPLIKELVALELEKDFLHHALIDSLHHRMHMI